VRLKALELHGFKSFADHVRLEFPGAVTAIVGPNGSGKSNIAEAIRWVLGEQSLSTLRARRGEDLIFAGSDQRPRAGMAEVTLIFDNADGELPVEFTEVALTRRVYRDGEGEYLLNGSRVRLRDIQELLGSTPLARRTYTVIGQGVVDEVLRMRPEERRALFEEAAGIALYRMKREEALRRLEATQQNLARARDLLAELTPRLNTLRRQAERARQYEELRAQLQARWRRWAARRMARLRRGLEAARAALAEAEAARLRHQELQAAAEQQALALREAIRRQQAVLAEQEAARARLREESAAAQRQLQAIEEALQALSEQEKARRERAEALEARQAALRAMQETLEAERTALEDRLGALRQQRQELEALYASKRARAEALRRQREEIREAIRRQEEEETRIIRRQQALQEARRELEERSLQQAAQRTRWIQEHADGVREQERLREELRRLEATLEALERERAHALQQLAEAEAEVQRAREQVAEARAQAAYLEAYAEHLARGREAPEGRAEDLRAVLAAGLPGVLGSLMDFLEVEAGWETAAAALLGPLLQAAVVQDRSAVERARPLIRHGLPVVILSALRVERPRPAPATPGRIALPARRVALPARPAATILRAREPRLQAWLERHLEDIWLVENWEQAVALWPVLPRTARILTRDGERIGGEGILWIGRYGAPEVVWLAQEQAWRSLPERIRAAQAALRRAEEALEARERQRQQWKEKLAALEAAARAAEAQREALQRQLRDLEAAVERAAKALPSLEREIAEAEQRRAQIEAEHQALERRRQALAQERRALEASQAALDAEIAALDLEAVEAGLARLRAEERLLEEQHRQAVEMLARHREALQAAEAEWAALSAATDDPRAALEAEHAQWRDRQHALAAQLRELEAQHAREMAALLEAESQFEEAWKQVEDLREAGRALEERVHAARLEVVRWEGEVRAFQQALHEEWRYLGEEGGDPEAEIPEVEEEEEGEPLEALEEEVDALRRALRRLGPINPEAAAEYAALQERHSFLTSQIADLEAAAASLRQTIAALDQQMQQAFMETFRAVGRAFKETFIELFGGGNARLALTEAESWDQAGVEIFVRVPGKRTQNLMMLSGGEKALTATALIFALLQVRPSPFVVLDEADAALDEANIGRFREMIRRLSGRTQFILITHNRGTVEAADVLYGVTLRPDGASQVLSLRLEEAERILAQ